MANRNASTGNSLAPDGFAGSVIDAYHENFDVTFLTWRR
jgi:hypothetical protein